MQASFHHNDTTIDGLFETASATDLFVGLLVMSSPTTQAFVQRLLVEGGRNDGSGVGAAWWDAANKHRADLEASLSLKWRSLCLRALRGGMGEQEGVQRPQPTSSSNDTPTPLTKRASSLVRPSTSLQVEREVQRVFSTFMKEGGSGSPSRAGSMRNPRKADLAGSKRRNRSVTFDSNAFDHEDVESGSGGSDSGDMPEVSSERKGSVASTARHLDVSAIQLRALYDARAQQHEEELAAVEREKEVDCARLVKQVDRLATMVLNLKEQLEVENTKHRAEMDTLHGLHESVLNHIAQDDARILNTRYEEEERLRDQLDGALRREEDATASFGRFVSRHPELIDVSPSNQTPTKPQYGRIVTVDNRRRRPQTAGSIRLDVKGRSISDMATSARPPSSLAAELFSSPSSNITHVN